MRLCQRDRVLPWISAMCCLWSWLSAIFFRQFKESYHRSLIYSKKFFGVFFVVWWDNHVLLFITFFHFLFLKNNFHILFTSIFSKSQLIIVCPSWYWTGFDLIKDWKKISIYLSSSLQPTPIASLKTLK